LITLYGIATCDSCRTARAWLAGRGVAYRWHDLRKDGLDRATLARWIAAVGADALLNRRSATWRGLGAAEREIADAAAAAALMQRHPTLIKRPVIEASETVLVGFTDAVRARIAALESEAEG